MDSRNITAGTYIEKADTVSIAQSIGAVKGEKELPESISSEQWADFLYVISQFLDSKEAENLTVANHRIVQDEFKSAEAADLNSGWKRFREFLGDSANAITILTPIANFIAANSGQIAQWIQNIFLVK